MPVQPRGGLLCGNEKLNRNFVLNLVLAACSGFADSLAGGTVGVAFIYAAFGESNAKVGFAEALSGLSSLVTALPAGWAADKYPRSRITKVGGVTSLLAMPLFAYAVLEATATAESGETSHRAFVTLCTAFALYGFGSGIGNGPAQALLADSIPTGQRSKYYDLLFQAYVIPGVLGPIIGIAWFLSRGDSWSLVALRDLMLVGALLQFPIAACMCLFRDSETLGRESEAVTDRKAGSARNGDRKNGGWARVSEATSSGLSLPEHDGLAAGYGDNCDEGFGGGGGGAAMRCGANASEKDTLKSPLLPPEVAATAACDGPLASGGGDGSDGEACDDAKFAVHPMAGRVPYIVFISGLIVALASGMTIKYFPLYFKNTLGFTPASVQAIYVAVPLAMALASGVTTGLSKHIGRVQAVLLVRFAGLSCFAAMVMLDQKAYRATSWGPWAIVFAYVARTALMNCTYPVEESILMDYASKATRARWKSLESVSVAGWCGSAFLGGILADAYGYTFTFVITIAVQAAGTLVYASLLGIVVVEEDGDEAHGKASGQADGKADGEAGEDRAGAEDAGKKAEP